IGGANGAAAIAAYCKANNIHFGFYLDEGGLVSEGLVPGMKRDVALVGNAEKGYATFELTVNMKGGHSSRPPAESSLDVLVNAVKKLHDNKFETRATPSVEGFIDYVGPEMQMPLKMVFANKWLLKPVILSQYAATEDGNAMVRTTGVTTVMNAGVKENVIPSKVSAKVNYRILPGESVSSVRERVIKIINDRRVEISILESYEPSETTPADSWGFKLIQATSAEIFPDAVVAPFLMVGSTDSKRFTGLTDETFRFFPTRMDHDALAGFHGINERIKVSYYMQTIAFYKHLMEEMQTFETGKEK
ncbi:MAG TPA: peptidase dimerization domain-containing protein, partial [Chitinophagales bacterium]|nr:peptidase dimerization domain-containing protein [Chitinophagales bacterium]